MAYQDARTMCHPPPHINAIANVISPGSHAEMLIDRQKFTHSTPACFAQQGFPNLDNVSQ
jgi:hypothetical protein